MRVLVKVFTYHSDSMTNTEAILERLIGTPMALINYSRVYRSAIFVFFVALTLSLVATYFAEQFEREQHRHLFDQHATQMQVIIVQNLKSSKEAFQALDSLYKSRDYITRNEFSLFAKPILDRHPAIQALEWIPAIPNSERKEYVQQAHVDGLSDFQIRQRNAEGKMEKASERETYYPVYFLNPLKGNDAALGFDLGSEQNRLQALERARDTGGIIATRRITLVQGKTDQYGFLLFKAVYKHGAPTDTIELRRKHLRGFTLGVFKIGDIIELNMDTSSAMHKNIQAYVFDKSTPNVPDLLYPKMDQNIAHSAVKKNQCTDASIALGDREWAICVCETHPHRWMLLSNRALLTLISGLTISFLVGFYTQMLVRRRFETEKFAKTLEAEISERNVLEARKAELEIELRHAQKLEAVGQLAGGIAHEINTPVQYIGDNIRFLQQSITDLKILINLAMVTANEEVKKAAEETDLDYLMEEMPLAAKQSLEGVGQVSDIVKAMKNFAHPGGSEKAQIDVNEAIHDTLMVCRGEWKHIAEIDLDLDETLPPLFCHGGQLNQVFLNLIVNSAHAIGAKFKNGQLGKIEIKTFVENGGFNITFSDNGCGIDGDIIGRIFDPFFTTKEIGMGSGQGLSIVYDIIANKHGGKVKVSSEINAGTVFKIVLPIAENEEA